MNVVELMAGKKVWFRTGEVAELLGVNPSTVRRWIREGKLKAYRVGEQFRIHIDDIRAFLKEYNIDEKILDEVREDGGKN